MATAQGYNPHDPWVAGYVDYEWERLRHVIEAQGLDLHGLRALEFGCNMGCIGHRVCRRMGARVVALEIDPALLAIAVANAARHGADIDFVLGTADDRLAFDADSFDLVVCNSVLEYVPADRLPRVVAELTRVIKPGGRLMLLGTSSRLWPVEVHSRRWFVNYVPVWTDRYRKRPLQRGLWPPHLRGLFGPAFRNLDIDDGGRAWLAARAAFNGGAMPLSMRVLRHVARVSGIGPGWLTQSLSAVLQKQGATSTRTMIPQRKDSPMTLQVAVIVGSLRKDSFNRKLAVALAGMAPAGLELKIAEIGQLPLYNQDDDAAPPAASVAFKKAIQESQAVLFLTPEYNRSMPGVLKNAIDIASRPYGQSAWDKKPGAVISLSPGAMGGFGANHHLRQSLTFLNVPVLQQPEAYIGGAGDLFDDAGGIKKPDTKAFLQKFLVAFEQWIDKTKS